MLPKRWCCEVLLLAVDVNVVVVCRFVPPGLFLLAGRLQLDEGFFFNKNHPGEELLGFLDSTCESSI